MGELESLRALLDRAYEAHGDKPAEFACALAARCATFEADAEAGEAIRMAEHLWLGHLGDTGALATMLDALPGTLLDADATAPSVRRARWAIAVLQGRAGPDLDEAPRWRALQNVVLALAETGHAVRARAALLAEEDGARGSADSAARQAYAAGANNVALHLRLGPRGDAARDALMLAAAELARRAWGDAGTGIHVERAEYQLAMCHAALGAGAAALRHARQCLAGCEAAGADAVERFFAHEALAHAHRAGADVRALARQVDAMRALLPTIADDGMRAWCATALDALAG